MKKRTLKRTFRIFAFAFVLLISVLMLSPMPSQAQTSSWTGGGDGVSWSDLNNWDAGVPVPGGSALISLTWDAVNYDYNYDLSNPLGSLQIDIFSQLTHLGDYTLTVYNTVVGVNGLGFYSQSAGTHHIDNNGEYNPGDPYGVGNLTLGLEIGATGTYELSGSGTLNVGVWTFVGFQGSGYFTQSGGTHTVRDDLNLGYSTGSYGEYNLSDGTLDARFQYIGGDGGGTGLFNQTGGTNKANNQLVIGVRAYDPSANATYNLQNGDLITGEVFVGYEGTGTFNHSGGTNTVGGDLILGHETGSIGTYILSQADPNVTSVLTVGGSRIVGKYGTGTFTQTGGEHNVNGGYLIWTNGAEEDPWNRYLSWASTTGAAGRTL